jgi:hypothetical protein
MHSSIRLLTEGAIGLRALMTCMLARLIDVSASQGQTTSGSGEAGLTCRFITSLALHSAEEFFGITPASGSVARRAPQTFAAQ